MSLRPWPQRVRTAMTVSLIGLGIAPTAGQAENLAEAITLAYQSNPILQAQRAQQRELDETYVQARAGWRPTASATGQANWSRTDLGKEYANQGEIVSNGMGGYSEVYGGFYQENYGDGQISFTQPIYTGGKTAATVKATEATVLAGRETLRTVEAQIILGVVTAYEAVRLNQQILGIRSDNAGVLRSQLEETQAKLDVGQGTRTDVAQAQAQLASAHGQLAVARANLQISRANYAAVVGQNPGELAPEPRFPGLPGTVDQAFDVADSDNPALRQAELTEQSSRARIVEVKAANRPTVTAVATVGYLGALQPFQTPDFNRTVSGQVTIVQPIFTGGLNSSLIREAVEQNTSDRIRIEGVRRSVVQTVAQAWNTMVGAQASVISNEEQVRAAEVAFEGIREQYRVGLSTTLDVLIQQTNLENAQLALVQARHDAYVAQASLLQAMGRLEARVLLTGAPLYDPAKSFNRVKNAGAVPWEPLIAVLDSLGARNVSMPAPISAPVASGQVPSSVTMIPVEQAVPANDALSTAQPATPAPNTTVPLTPPTLGAKPNPGAQVPPTIPLKP